MFISNLNYILLIAAIVLVLLSRSIDRAAKAGGRLERVLWVCSVAVACIFLLPLVFRLF